VLAASYEARPFGCRSAMPMATAMRLCPDAVVVRPRMGVYAEISRAFRALLDGYTPLVEPISIDEAFLDVTGTERLFGPPGRLAEALRGRVRAELGLTASVGGAAVKLVAKIACDLAKPDGQLLVAPAETARFLAPLPVERLYGVGKKTAERLRGQGITTIGQLADHPAASLERRLGSLGRELAAQAHGIDPRPVDPGRDAVSVGAEETFEHDLDDGPALRRHVTAQAERVAERLRRGGHRGQTVVLKLKDPAFHLTTRRRTLAEATDDGRAIAAVALALLTEARVGPPGVRLSGVSMTGLVAHAAPQQLLLDQRARRAQELGRTLDAIHDRFGEQALGRADLMYDGEDDEGG
jgi:DNA polymerase-4